MDNAAEGVQLRVPREAVVHGGEALPHRRQRLRHPEVYPKFYVDSVWVLRSSVVILIGSGISD